MSDSTPSHPPARDLEEIPVDELIRMTREFTRRITNQDRQRLGVELRESGHTRNIQISAPVTLQQFFSGEIDLDTDLARRFANAPLLSHIQFVPKRGEPVQRQATALLSSNDDSATLAVDALVGHGPQTTLEFTVTLFSALALRFRLSPLATADRSRWIELVRRESGIAFLWTRERWEQPYTIFVVREHFARLYAFSPQGFEAAVRLTPDTIQALVDWLEELWFPERREAAAPPPKIEAPSTPPVWNERPTHAQRPAQNRLPSFLSAVPDRPEEQWEDPVPPPAPPPDVEENDLPPENLDW